MWGRSVRFPVRGRGDSRLDTNASWADAAMDSLPKKAKEGDVETRVVLPLLTRPEYLAIPSSSIRSKAYLTPQRIDKAAGRTTGYYPDYSLWESSFPLAIVEAKAPSVAAEVGYREASLYALHL